jgi:hypothetical protein
MRKSGRIQREFLEGKALVQWADLQWFGRALHHSPNEELHPIARQLASASGTRAGFPDYVLPLRAGSYVGCAIELKARRPYGAAVTPKQRGWLEHLEHQGWRTAVCYGAGEAIEVLTEYAASAARPTK